MRSLTIAVAAAAVSLMLLAGAASAASPTHETVVVDAHVDVFWDCGDFVVRGDWFDVPIDTTTFFDSAGVVTRVHTEIRWDGRISNVSDPSKSLRDRGHFVIEDWFAPDGTWIRGMTHTERGTPGIWRDTWNGITGPTGREKFVGPVGPSVNINDMCVALR